jgi:predicted enzyme related to lactoylglutathione lyase
MHVQGVGGLFMRARDPLLLGQWYQKHFGLQNGGVTETQAGPLVFATFDRQTDYFGSAQSFMLNLRVTDLTGFLKRLAADGVLEAKPRETMEGVGHFAWVTDPEGNRIELWEPT